MKHLKVEINRRAERLSGVSDRVVESQRVDCGLRQTGSFDSNLVLISASWNDWSALNIPVLGLGECVATRWVLLEARRKCNDYRT